MKVMTVSLSPDPSPARGEGRFVSRIRDFHINTTYSDSEDQARSKITAMPCPPPMHMVTSAYLPPTRCNS